MINIIQKRKMWLTISGITLVIGIAALFIWGINFGIDFSGGALLEVKFKENRPASSEIITKLENLELGSLSVQPIGESGAILRFKDISQAKHSAVLARLDGQNVDEKAVIEAANIASGTASVKIDTSNLKNIEELRYDSVGPSIGKDLRSRSVTAIIIVLIAIMSYIAYAFRKVSKPVESWKYGLSAVIALFHDLIITAGVFAIFAHYLKLEVNTSFVAALLTVLGYSVHDTIVVFDRTRENLPKSNLNFEDTVNLSVNQTFGRSINTSVTVILTLLAILFFGGATIRDFALTLAIGIFIGTYSSIFVASPMLVIWEKIKKD